MARLFAALWGGPETLIVVSSDLSHYLPYDAARGRDRDTARHREPRSAAHPRGGVRGRADQRPAAGGAPPPHGGRDGGPAQFRRHRRRPRPRRRLWRLRVHAGRAVDERGTVLVSIAREKSPIPSSCAHTSGRSNGCASRARALSRCASRAICAAASGRSMRAARSATMSRTTRMPRPIAIRASRRFRTPSASACRSRFRCSRRASPSKRRARRKRWRGCTRAWTACASSFASSTRHSCRRCGRTCPIRSISCAELRRKAELPLALRHPLGSCRGAKDITAREGQINDPGERCIPGAGGTVSTTDACSATCARAIAACTRASAAPASCARAWATRWCSRPTAARRASASIRSRRSRSTISCRAARAVLRHRGLQPGVQVLPELGHLEVARDRHG